MYKVEEYNEISFFDFNQECGMQLDENNEWIMLSKKIDWKQFEELYKKNFKSKYGNRAKSFRVAFGALIIQKIKRLSDRELVKEITENPYLQFFIGMKKFDKKKPFASSLLVYFRKRLTVDIINEINEKYLKSVETIKEDKEIEKLSEKMNLGTAILDATCSPSNIKYPQDYVLLNRSREKLEEIIDYFHKEYKPYNKPRTYRKVAHKEYLQLAKSKKKTQKQIRKVIRKQLNCIKRDIEYIEKYKKLGYEIPKKYTTYYETIKKIYNQQLQMYNEKTHHIENRITSINQPYIRPIVRGKVKTPVEFGAKYDVSINEKGYARLEKISFDPYNESTVLKDCIERYKNEYGHYPERILVDQIYRTKENKKYCEEHNIRMSGIKLGSKNDKNKKTKTDYKDEIDRIEIERFFSLEKSKFGANLITTKLKETTFSSIALSILCVNLVRIKECPIFLFYFCCKEKEKQNNHYIMIKSA